MIVSVLMKEEISNIDNLSDNERQAALMITIKIELKSLPDLQSIEAEKTGEVTLTANDQKSYRTVSPDTETAIIAEISTNKVLRELQHGMHPRHH